MAIGRGAWRRPVFTRPATLWQDKCCSSIPESSAITKVNLDTSNQPATMDINDDGMRRDGMTLILPRAKTSSQGWRKSVIGTRSRYVVHHSLNWSLSPRHYQHSTTSMFIVPKFIVYRGQYRRLGLVYVAIDFAPSGADNFHSNRA